MRADGGSGHDGVLTEPVSWVRSRSTRLGAAAVIAGLVCAQAIASIRGLHSPIHGLADDFLGRGMIGVTPWAALGLALIGLANRARAITIAVLAAVTAITVAVQLGTGTPPAELGSHVSGPPLMVLAALAVYVTVRWRGAQRDNAVRGLALAALLVAAAKVGDLWFIATVQAGPQVLDQFTLHADEALGQPSWRVGQALAALGPVPSAVLHMVYAGLPIAAMAATIWQLRAVRTSGWPGHYLVRTFLVLGLTGPLIYLIFPVVGPVYAFGPAGSGWEVADIWPQSLPTVTSPPAPFTFTDGIPRNCMPSMHTAWALAVFIHSRRGPRWLRWGGTFWLLATLAATLGFGFHYGVDLVAGAVLCLTVESALREPALGWTRYRWRLVGAGLTVLVLLLVSFRFFATALASAPLIGGAIILAMLGATVLVFYACWFAAPGTALGILGKRWLGITVPQNQG